MIKLTQAELDEKLRLHKLWLDGKPGGVRLAGEYDMSGLNMDYATMDYALLDHSIMNHISMVDVSMNYVTIIGATMNDASMVDVSMNYVTIIGATMIGVTMVGVTMVEASMINAIMNDASMVGVTMNDATMVDVSMNGATMVGVTMNGATMVGVTMAGATLDGATSIPYIPLACPDTGSFIGWKKVSKRIIRLEIPEDAKRSSATTNKCRCDKARVIAIENMDGTDSGLMEIVNDNYAKCVYRVGEMVYPDSFDDCRWNECSHGIHFFINRQDAVNW